MPGFKVENILFLFICLYGGIMMLSPGMVRPESVDFHVHDTYYIVSGLYVALFLLMYCLLLFALYRMLRRRRRDIHFGGALFHILVTIFFVVIFLRSESLLTYSGPIRRDRSPGMVDWLSQIKFRFIITSVFTIVQAGFFFYFFVEWFRTKRKS